MGVEGVLQSQPDRIGVVERSGVGSRDAGGAGRCDGVTLDIKLRVFSSKICCSLGWGEYRTFHVQEAKVATTSMWPGEAHTLEVEVVECILGLGSR